MITAKAITHQELWIQPSPKTAVCLFVDTGQVWVYNSLHPPSFCKFYPITYVWTLSDPLNWLKRGLLFGISQFWGFQCSIWRGFNKRDTQLPPPSFPNHHGTIARIVEDGVSFSSVKRKMSDWRGESRKMRKLSATEMLCLGGPFASSQSYMYHCPTMNPQLEMVDSWVYHMTSFGGHGCEYLPHGRVEQIRFSNYSFFLPHWVGL